MPYRYEIRLEMYQWISSDAPYARCPYASLGVTGVGDATDAVVSHLLARDAAAPGGFASR